MGLGFLLGLDPEWDPGLDPGLDLGMGKELAPMVLGEVVAYPVLGRSLGILVLVCCLCKLGGIYGQLA